MDTAINSRFRFSELPIDLAYQRLCRICDQENVHLVNSEEMLKVLLKGCDGDLRHAITTLQCIVATAGNEVTVADIEEALGMVSNKLIDSIVETCWSVERPPATKKVIKLASDTVREGFSIGRLVCQLQEALLSSCANSTSSDPRLARALDAIGRAEERCLDGADEYLTLLDLLLAL